MGEVFRFIPKSGLNVRHAAQRQDMDKAIFEKRTESADAPPTKVFVPSNSARFAMLNSRWQPLCVKYRPT